MEEEEVQSGDGGVTPLGFFKVVLAIVFGVTAVFAGAVALAYMDATYVDPMRLQNEATRHALQQQDYCGRVHDEVRQLRREKQIWEWAQQQQNMVVKPPMRDAVP